jgi:deferrochelatase/peroxidase EfeB
LINRFEREGAFGIRAIELGTALRNNEGEGIEHFGYVDGRSQPLFLASDFKNLTLKEDNTMDLVKTKERVNDKAAKREGADINIWNPFASIDLVLREDPGTTVPDSYGSYFVFRKLEQDVLRFSIAEQQLADILDLKGKDRERAGAMMVGRFRDGNPLAVSETEGLVPAKENNFRYDSGRADGTTDEQQKDLLGLKCPFHAHIRKTSPRQSENKDSEKIDLGRRIARRGIPYCERNKHPDAFQSLDDLPIGDVGLLFACFQESIVNQYGFMQKPWANNANFKVPLTSIDPLVGQLIDLTSESRPDHQWRPSYGAALGEELPQEVNLEITHKELKRIDNFVHFRGGEFLFAPSMSFLIGLKN